MTHANNHLPLAFEDWLLAGSPAAIRRESLQRRHLTTDHAAALVTQVMTHVAVPVNVGDVITNISFLSGATAAGTPTNWFFALYDASGTLLAQSADQTTAEWAADTVKTLALATPQTISVDGIVYAAIMVKATTVPSLVGSLMPRAAVSTGVLSQKRLAGNSGSALTATAPATIATPTAQVQVPYCVLT